MDHHHLDCLADESFDGVYTTETLVHAPDPEKSIGRILPRDQAREGGSIVLHQIRSSRFQTLFPKTFQKNFDESMEHINKRAFDASKTSLSYMVVPCSVCSKNKASSRRRCGRSGRKEHQTYGAAVLPCGIHTVGISSYVFLRLQACVREHSGRKGTGLVVYSPPPRVRCFVSAPTNSNNTVPKLLI